jgi:hypothetical protein
LDLSTRGQISVATLERDHVRQVLNEFPLIGEQFFANRTQKSLESGLQGAQMLLNLTDVAGQRSFRVVVHDGEVISVGCATFLGQTRLF